ncbi:hypothetical protein MRB53_039033 [Persea americana]|nr:hypothetical protein MRB53_039033 [Persea americana]
MRSQSWAFVDIVHLNCTFYADEWLPALSQQNRGWCQGRDGTSKRHTNARSTLPPYSLRSLATTHLAQLLSLTRLLAALVRSQLQDEPVVVLPSQCCCEHRPPRPLVEFLAPLELEIDAQMSL